MEAVAIDGRQLHPESRQEKRVKGHHGLPCLSPHPKPPIIPSKPHPEIYLFKNKPTHPNLPIHDKNKHMSSNPKSQQMSQSLASRLGDPPPATPPKLGLLGIPQLPSGHGKQALYRED